MPFRPRNVDWQAGLIPQKAQPIWIGQLKARQDSSFDLNCALQIHHGRTGRPCRPSIGKAGRAKGAAPTSSRRDRQPARSFAGNGKSSSGRYGSAREGAIASTAGRKRLAREVARCRATSDALSVPARPLHATEGRGHLQWVIVSDRDILAHHCGYGRL